MSFPFLSIIEIHNCEHSYRLLIRFVWFKSLYEPKELFMFDSLRYFPISWVSQCMNRLYTSFYTVLSHFHLFIHLKRFSNFRLFSNIVSTNQLIFLIWTLLSLDFTCFTNSNNLERYLRRLMDWLAMDIIDRFPFLFVLVT